MQRTRKEKWRETAWRALMFVLGMVAYGVADYLEIPGRTSHLVLSALSSKSRATERKGLHEDPTVRVENGQVRVAIYNGASRQRLFIGVGGSDFEMAAKSSLYRFRINANSQDDAIRGLADLRTRIVAKKYVLVGAALFDHGKRASQFLGDNPVDGNLWAALEAVFPPDRLTPHEVWLFGCSIAKSFVGQEFIQLLANGHGFTVYASSQTVEYLVGLAPADNPKRAIPIKLNKEEWWIALPRLNSAMRFVDYEKQSATMPAPRS